MAHVLSQTSDRAPLSPAPLPSNSLRDQTFSMLLHASQMASPTYQGKLANHLPMTLIAMQRMGASNRQMTRFYHAYADKLDIAYDPAPQQQYLYQLLIRNNRQRVVLEQLTRLAEGISASAFHALIRLGYAVMMNEPYETAIALSYLANEYQSLGALSDPEPHRTDQNTTVFNEIIQFIRTHPELSQQPLKAPNIIVRLDKVAALPAFHEVIAQLNTCQPTLEELQSFSLSLYLSTFDFTALHCVTSCHALRRIFEFIEPKRGSRDDFNEPFTSINISDEQFILFKQRLLKYYALSLCAAYISIKTPTLVELDLDDSLSRNPTNTSKDREWTELFAIALDRDDDHDIKAVFSCYEEFQETGDHRYWVAAKGRLKL